MNQANTIFSGKFKISFIFSGLFFTGVAVFLIINPASVEGNLILAIIVCLIFGLGFLFSFLFVLSRRIIVNDQGISNNRFGKVNKLEWSAIKNYKEKNKKEKLPLLGLFMPWITIGKYFELTIISNDEMKNFIIDSRYLRNYKELAPIIKEKLKPKEAAS